MEKQTAVDFIMSRVKGEIHPADMIIFEIAKALEKQQIVDAVWFGHDNKPEMIHVPESFGGDYYESTFKTKEEK